jgi:acyl dehydratase
MSQRTFDKLTQLQAMVGQSLGTSDWITVDQQRIERFADATADHQWIHTDAERAAQGPFGTTIAHGFLTLSLLPAFLESAFDVADSPMGVNYGLNRVRFTSPVPAGSRLRAHFKLLAYQPIEGGAQLTVEATIEREGAQKPACVLESLTRRYL